MSKAVKVGVTALLIVFIGFMIAVFVSLIVKSNCRGPYCFSSPDAPSIRAAAFSRG